MRSSTTFKKGHHPKNEFKKGSVGYWKGKKRSEETKKKMRDSWTEERKISKSKEIDGKFGFGTRFKNGIEGNKHPSWKGGAVNYQKRQSLIRDNYTCQICGLRDEEIVEVDHIIPKSVRIDLIAELSNLMTLCPNCHSRKTKRDIKIYGKK